MKFEENIKIVPMANIGKQQEIAETGLSVLPFL